MKILIYDRDLFNSGTRYPLKEAFEHLGHKVDMFDWQYYLASHTKPKIINKIRDKFFISHIKDINHDLQFVIKKGNYDMLLVVMGKYLFPETIELATSKIKYVVNWNTDDPLNKINTSKWLLKALPLYDAHFTPRIHISDKYKEHGVKNIFELDWYYRYGIKPYKKIPSEFKYDCNFIASWSPRRYKYIKNIIEKNANIDVFGWGWNKKNKELPSNKLHASIGILEMMDIYNNSKISINLLTMENQDTTNLRNYEVSYAHGFQLCEKSDKLATMFKEDKEIVFFSSPEELADKYMYYLKNNDERNKIADNCYLKIINGRNSLIDRVEQIINQTVSLR